MFGPDTASYILGAGVLLAGVGLGLTVLRIASRRRTTPDLAARPGSSGSPWCASDQPRRQPVPAGGHMPGERILAAFCGWLAEHEGRSDAWTSFDQMVRETLAEHLAAARVRCYHVRPESETLLTLAQAEIGDTPSGPSARAGVLGHVATGGKEFVARDAACGALVHDLADEAGDGWSWVWPIRCDNATVGMIAVADLQDPDLLTGELRQTVGQLVSLCWRQVGCHERLRILRQTDQATGVLTRNEFFTLAERALADSYEQNEPVVAVVLALEGLRRLDDTQCWTERDTLVERLGHVLATCVRSDDLIGRFADDRFAVLLRRLDSGLGRLIAEKMLTASNECVGEMGSIRAQVRLRVGLSGSGFARPPLEQLLNESLDAVARARREDVSIKTDLEPPRIKGAGK